MTTTRKLSVALLVAAGVFGVDLGVSQAQTATVLKVFGSSTKDLAPAATQTGYASRLRRDQNNQPGHEHAAIAMFGDNVHGIIVDRASNINGVRATDPNDDGNGNAVQGAMAMFKLQADANGVVSAVLDTSYTPQFITSHGSEQYRAFNQPDAYPINNGTAIAVEYNWRKAGGGNRTVRMLQVFNMQGQQILKNGNTTGEKEIYAKTNDDCNMNMDGHAGVVASFDATKVNSHIVMWRGCNGNGADEGWMDVMDITCDSATAPTTCTHKDAFDIALDQDEERSRGYCSVGTNPNIAVCTWTAGNNQPQRGGTWMAASDITPGTTGNDRQDKILWMTMIDGRKTATSDGIPNTYSERIMHERILAEDANGNLLPTDSVIVRTGDGHGNNDNNRKGGRYYRDNIAVYQISPDITCKTGCLKAVVPLQDMSKTLLGLDGTHLVPSFGLFGTEGSLKPGLMLVGGSQTGGGVKAQVSMLGFDAASSSFKLIGTGNIAPYDRGLYSNDLGQNPGNQGRNFAASVMVPNVACTSATPGCTKYLALFATTGKDPTEVATANADGSVNDTCYAADDTTKTNGVPCARLKLSSYISVLPIAQTAAAGSGSGSGSGSGGGGGSGSGSSSDGSGSDPGTSLGGCSTTGGAGGAATFLLIGLAAIIRRRR